MTEPHHDDELCRRIQYKVFEESEMPMFSDEDGASHVRLMDFCCNPVDSWKLELKMKELGFGYRYDSFEDHTTTFSGSNPRPTAIVDDSVGSTNRLYLTAMCADWAVDDD